MNRRVSSTIAFGALAAFAGAFAGAQVRNDTAYSAILEGEPDSLEDAIRSGLSPNARLLIPDSTESISALELAIAADNEEAAILLLEYGATPGDLPGTPSRAKLIEYAAMQDMPSLLDRLINADPTALVTVASGNHPLIVAAGSGGLESVQLLLKNLLAFSAFDDRSAVLTAALGAAMTAPPQSASRIMALLIDAGADDGPVSLAGTVTLCRADLVRFFLERERDPEDLFEGKSAAQHAIECLSDERIVNTRVSDDGVAILRMLDRAGVDVCTPLVAQPLGQEQHESLMRRFNCR